MMEDPFLQDLTFQGFSESPVSEQVLQFLFYVCLELNPGSHT
jgi:hypothetical protein